MLVNRREQAVPSQRRRHREGADSIHVGGHDGDSSPGLPAVTELEGPFQLHLRATAQRRPLGTDKNVLKTQFQVGFNAHLYPPVQFQQMPIMTCRWWPELLPVESPAPITLGDARLVHAILAAEFQHVLHR